MKVQLKSWQSYSPQERAQLFALSPAIQHYAELIERHAPTSLGTAQSADELRLLRHQFWIESAAATLLKTHSAADVCLYWSQVTDDLVQRAWALCGLEGLPVSLWALGKWGAQELNLSSDIDVMFISEESPDATLLKKVRSFVQFLSENSAFGFMYRVDSDLKPGGRLAPLVSSYKQTEDYYWSVGATWERLALVRLRPICGPQALTQKVIHLVDKFVFRKFIDFALLDDLKHLRRQIHAHALKQPSEKINLKLYPGGIRDIELFVHALQVIHGGKDKEIRKKSTTTALHELISKKRFAVDDLRFLEKCYWQFRDWENCVQAVSDQQTHDIDPAQQHKEFDLFLKQSAQVSQIVEYVLGEVETAPQMPTADPEKTNFLQKLGFSDPDSLQRVDELLSLTAFSKTYQYEDMRLKVLRRFLECLSEVAPDKRLGLGLLVDFFRATRAKAGFFTLLLHEDRLIQELSLLFGTSPYLGSLLSARPELLDSYLFRTLTPAPKDPELFFEFLAEKKLLNELIVAHQFLLNHQLEPLLVQAGDCADEITLALLDRLQDVTAPCPLQILALGKWGGKELGLKSDLDFIFITPDAPSEKDQKLARRFIARLTEAHRGGSIYAIDLRLRPSGKSGPLIVSQSSLLDYLQTQAEPWERQSYLRARLLGSENFELENKIRLACVDRGLSKNDLTALIKIRQQLIDLKHNQDDLKYAAGGLMDLEMTAQLAVLSKKLSHAPTNTLGMLNALGQHMPDWALDAPTLIENYRFLRTIEQLHQIVAQHSGSKINITDDSFLRLAKIFGAPADKIASDIRGRLLENCQILKRLDLRQQGE